MKLTTLHAGTLPLVSVPSCTPSIYNTKSLFAYANAIGEGQQAPVDPLSQDYYGITPSSGREPATGRRFSPDEPARKIILMDPDDPARHRGGAIRWIEERTGINISPEEFIQEGVSEEVLKAILENFTPEELEYLEKKDILTTGGTTGGYGSPPLPIYGQSGGGYNYPMYYGGNGYDSGPSYARTPILGLTSWSI